ncbi:hypothetical protein ILYODFUR_015876 [Ilyodon furcidens]|uniref:Uncharacterized protein n=1 Tax=Ilyodon furcidens TaxID=33524 RepID=A0ABV0U6D5_9TELE
MFFFVHIKKFFCLFLGLHGGAAGSTAALQQEVLGLTPGWGSFCMNLCVLPVPAWVLSGYSGFLPQSKNMTVRFIDLSKLLLGVCGCLSCVSLCCHVMVWQPVQGVPYLLPIHRWR